MSQFIINDKSINNELPKRQLLTNGELDNVNSSADFRALLEDKGRVLKGVDFNIQYEEQLKHLQEELVKLQAWIKKTELRVAILFEGRDAAGKGGTIKRFAEHLNPRSMRVVALNKPTEVESGQWYFRRYIKELPNPGEIVFFDRSWYNRAVVEPVMDFCDMNQYGQFMRQVPEFEHMLFEDGLHVTKFWFSISKQEQARRFAERRKTH